MNLKELLFNHLTQVMTTTPMTAKEEKVWKSLNLPYSLRVLTILFFIVSFIAGFSCWACLVFLKKRNNRNHYNHELQSISTITNENSTVPSNPSEINNQYTSFSMPVSQAAQSESVQTNDQSRRKSSRSKIPISFYGVSTK